MHFTQKIIDFILEVDRMRGISKDKNRFLGYYLVIWYLRDHKIVRQNGFNQKNQKVWVLTGKGKKVAELLKELKVIINGESSVT